MIKRLVKLPVSFLLILFFASCALAQASPEQCVLADAVRLQGLRLGMSPAEVQGVFGKDLKIKVKASGDRTFFQNYIEKDARGALGGVRALYLRFLDGGLYQIEIFYTELPGVSTLEDFAANLSAQLKLPANITWRFVNNRAVIDCGAFTLVADKPVNPRVELTDTAKLTEAAARRKKGE
jgi:hypothetical protein